MPVRSAADIELVLTARDEASRILQGFRRELAHVQAALGQASQAIGQSSGGFGALNRALGGAQAAARPAAQGMQQLGTAMHHSATQARDAAGRFTSASEAVDRIGPSASRAAQGLASLAQGAIAGAGAFVAYKGLDLVMSGVGAAVDFVGDNLIGLNDRLQQAEIGFATMLGSAEAASAFLDDLAAFAASTPFEFPELVQASQRLLAMGFAADDVVPLLTSVGDAVAALGAGRQGIDRVTLALGQMQARTKVTAGEMLQLTEAGIPAWQLLADHIGVSVAQLQEMVSAGEVASGTFIEAFQAFSAANFGGLMEQQAQTWSGALSNIQDNLSMAVAETGRAFFELLQDGAVALAQFTASDDFQQWAQGVETKVRGAADSLRAFVTDNRDDLLGIAQAFGDIAVNAGELAEGLGEAAVRFAEFLNAGRESEGGQLGQVREDLEDVANFIGVLGKIINAEAPTEAEWARFLGGPPEFHESLIAVLERFGAVTPDVTRNTDAIKKAIEDLTGTSIRSLQDFEASIGVSFANVDGVYQFFVGRTKEAHEQVMKWASAVGQAEPITGSYGDVLFEAGEAAEQFAAAQDLTVREGHRAIQTSRELGVAVGELADAYQPVSASARLAMQAVTDLASVNSTLDLEVKSAADGIAHWEGELRDAERAIEIVRGQIEKTGDPTGELGEKLATLNDIQARLASGIENDLNPAFVDSVIMRGEYQKQLDELNRKLADNEISQEQFAEAAAEIRSKLEEAQSPFGGLISKMDDLIAKVAELVDGLGELDGIHARPQVTVDGLVLAGAGEMGFTEFDGGPAVTGVASQIGEVADAIVNLNQQTAEVTVNLTDNASAPLGELAGQIDALDGASFTVVAQVDIGPALAAIAELDRYTPHSPAEKGPLSVLPNWDALFEGIAASAEHWTEEALKHLRAYVDTAKAIFDTFEAEIDLSTNFAQFQRGGGELPALDDVAPLVEFAQGVTRQLGESAAAFEEQFLKHAQTYASAARAGLDLIESAIGVVAGLDGVTVNLERALAAASQMKFLIEHILLSLGDSAAVIESGEGVDHPSVRGAGFVGLASAFAEQARPAVELIAAGADAFTALSNVDGSLDRALQAASAIKFLVEHIVLAIGDSAAVVTSDVDHPSARGGGFVDLAGEYAENAREAVALVNDALEFLSGLAELRGGVRLEQALAAASDLKFLVEHIVLSIGDAAAALAGSGTPEARPEGFLSAAREYAEHAGPAIALVSDTLDLLSQMGGAGRLPSLDEARAFADLLAQLTRVVAEAVAAAAAGWREEVNPALTAFQSEAGASLELAGSALDVLEGFEQFAGGRLDISDAAAQQFAARLAGLARLVADAFRAAAEGWNEDVDPALEVFRAEAGGSLELVGQAVDALQALMELRDPDGKQFDVAKAASELADNMALIIATIVELSEGWAQDADPALAAFHEDATGAFDVVSKAVGAINSLADMSRLGPTAMRTFLHNWEIVMDTFEEIARITEERGLDAAKQTLETIEEIAKTIQAANDAINAMGGDTGGSGGGRSGGGGGTGVGGGSGNMLSGGKPVLQGSLTIPSDFEFFSGQQQFDFSGLGLSPETLLDLINRGRGVLDTAGKRLFTDAQIATAIINWVLGGIPLPFAKGGIVTGRTLALLGDNPSGRELVLPLERADELGFGRAQQPMSAPAGPLVVQLVLDGRVIDERVINVLDTQWDRTLS